MVIKIDLAKAYDRVSWLFLRLLLLRIGFDLYMVKWVMVCATTMSFVVLVNGVRSPFFNPECGLHQGCPLSPYLFLFVMDGLSRAILDAITSHRFKGIHCGRNGKLTHLLFVDDVLIFYQCQGIDGKVLKEILDLFCDATGMVVNLTKPTIYFLWVDLHLRIELSNIFNFPHGNLEEGFKYLGFNLKPNKYIKVD